MLSYRPKIFEVSLSSRSELLIKEQTCRIRIPLARSVHLWSLPRGSVE